VALDVAASVPARHLDDRRQLFKVLVYPPQMNVSVAHSLILDVTDKWNSDSPFSPYFNDRSESALLEGENLWTGSQKCETRAENPYSVAVSCDRFHGARYKTFRDSNICLNLGNDCSRKLLRIKKIFWLKISHGTSPLYSSSYT